MATAAAGQLTLGIGGAMSKRVGRNKVSTRSKEIDPGYIKFWDWMNLERARRGMSLEDVVKKYKGKDRPTRQALQAAASNYSEPGPYFKVVAAAFDMSLVDVIKQTGLIKTVPDDVIVGSPKLHKFISDVSHLSDAQLDAVIAYQKALEAQMRSNGG